MALGKVGDYELMELLGEGLQGKVYLAEKKTEGSSGEKVALKFIFKDKMGDKQLQNLKREVAAMEAVKGHKHVVQMLGVEWDVKVPSEDSDAMRDAVCVALKLCNEGELFNYLMFTGHFDEKLARTYFHQFVKGLTHLHSKGFSHRDIKAENLLLNDGVLKIADFGFSAKHEINPGTLTKLRTQCGTPGYMAPELFDNIDGYDGPPVDVWASGVLLFIMLVGSPPMARAGEGDWWFDRLTAGQIDYFWRAHEQTGRILSDQAKDLIIKMLQPDAKERATIAEVMAHEWFKADVFSEADAIGQLRERKQVVEKKREEERKKAEQERRRKRTNRNRGAAFDPFQQTVFRSSDAGDATAQAATATKTQLFGAVFNDWLKLTPPPADLVAAAASSNTTTSPPVAPA